MVEDDRVDQMAFERMVQGEGLPYDYSCVRSVQEAAQALREGLCDVVVTDYRLSDGNGLDLLKDAAFDVPVILVTGAGGEEVAVQAMKAGAADYLMKDRAGNYLKTLPITVENALKAKATERELKKYHEQLEKLVQDRTIQLQEINVELRKENEERKRAEEALRAAHDKLEIRVEERTAELRETNQQLLQEVAVREQAESNLQKSKELGQAILNATTDCSFLLERDGTFVALNQRTAETLRRNADELIGESYFDLIPPDVAAERRNRFEEVIRSGQAVRFEDRGSGQIIDHSYHPVFDSDGSVERVAVFSREVTSQKKAQEISVQKQRLAALGEMAGGVAHNFNNLLQIVIGACGLAESDLESGDFDDVRATFKQIAESAQLGSETVKQLQDFARVRTEDPTVDGKVFDISDTVYRALEVSRPLWKTGPEKRGVNLEMKTGLQPGCHVKGQPNELFEVVVNLVKNAVEALSKGGTIYVKTYVKSDQTYLLVGDTGMGIPERNLNKIFEPFWTTKGVQGTGMGLSTSFGIVSRHGGLITVKSREGKGTIFTVKLPYAQPEADVRDSAGSSPLPFRARILIIDPNRKVTDFLENGFKRSGQTVFKARSGRDGLEIVAGKEIDAVICSLTIPDMDGWEVAKSVKRLCEKRGVPKIPFILLTSNGLSAEDRDKPLECGVNRIAEKPIQYNVLFTMVGQVLRQTASTSYQAGS